MSQNTLRFLLMLHVQKVNFKYDETFLGASLIYGKMQSDFLGVDTVTKIQVKSWKKIME